MLNSILLLGAATAAPVPSVSLPVAQDVQCFILYAMAVDAEQDEAKKHGASLGLMYFFTKLKVEAPAVDLVEMVREEANAIGSDPSIKATGDACDREFQQRGIELLDLGQKLQNSLPPPANT